MRWISRERLGSELLAGTFLNLGSHVSTEIVANLDFDWLLLDFEHGSGSQADLRAMLLACRGSDSAPIVRIRSVDADTVKLVMDSGAAGVMFPFVSDAETARAAVNSIKYPPMGKRGVAGVIRATSYGADWNTYFTQANAESLVVVQIETEQAVAAADEIAAVDGVDVLFVGPLDLSVNLGFPGDFSRPEFTRALARVIQACEQCGKTAGILSRNELVAQHKSMGFRFLALGSDAAAVQSTMKSNLERLRN